MSTPQDAHRWIDLTFTEPVELPRGQHFLANVSVLVAGPQGAIIRGGVYVTPTWWDRPFNFRLWRWHPTRRAALWLANRMWAESQARGGATVRGFAVRHTEARELG